MRPPSIVMFERLFLASLAVSVLGFIVSYREITETLARDPGVQQLGLGSGFIVGTAAAGYALYLLLWYLIARRASKVAKWILVVLIAISVLSTLPGLPSAWDTTALFGLVVTVLEIAAIVFLFRADATAWLDGKPPADPATFD